MSKLWTLSTSPFSKTILYSKPPEKMPLINTSPESIQNKGSWAIFTKKYSSYNKSAVIMAPSWAVKPRGSMKFSWSGSRAHSTVPKTTLSSEDMKVWERILALAVECTQTGLWKNLKPKKRNHQSTPFLQGRPNQCNSVKLHWWEISKQKRKHLTQVLNSENWACLKSNEFLSWLKENPQKHTISASWSINQEKTWTDWNNPLKS